METTLGVNATLLEEAEIASEDDKAAVDLFPLDDAMAIDQDADDGVVSSVESLEQEDAAMPDVAHEDGQDQTEVQQSAVERDVETTEEPPVVEIVADSFDDALPTTATISPEDNASSLMEVELGDLKMEGDAAHQQKTETHGEPVATIEEPERAREPETNESAAAVKPRNRSRNPTDDAPVAKMARSKSNRAIGDHDPESTLQQQLAEQASHRYQACQVYLDHLIESEGLGSLIFGHWSVASHPRIGKRKRDAHALTVYFPDYPDAFLSLNRAYLLPPPDVHDVAFAGLVDRFYIQFERAVLRSVDDGVEGVVECLARWTLHQVCFVQYFIDAKREWMRLHLSLEHQDRLAWLVSPHHLDAHDDDAWMHDRWYPLAELIL
jgi:hypothetical protein